MIASEWIPVVSAVVGGATGVVGTLTTQAFTIKRDRDLRAADAEREMLVHAREQESARSHSLSDARTKQLSQALELHQLAIAWVGRFHAERRDKPRVVSADVLSGATDVMGKCAEVIVLGENDLSKTARNIYKYFATAFSSEGGSPRAAYLVDDQTTELEAEVHSLVASMQPPPLEPWEAEK